MRTATVNEYQSRTQKILNVYEMLLYHYVYEKLLNMALIISWKIIKSKCVYGKTLMINISDQIVSQKESKTFIKLTRHNLI